MRLLALSACIVVVIAVVVKADEASSAPVTQSNFALGPEPEVIDDYITEPEFRSLFLRALAGPTAETPHITVAELRRSADFFSQDEATIQAAFEAGCPTGFEDINEEGSSSYYLAVSDQPTKADCTVVETTLDTALAYLKKMAIDRIPFLGALSGIVDGVLNSLGSTIRAGISGLRAVVLGPVNAALTTIIMVLSPLGFVAPINSVTQFLKNLQSTATLYVTCAAETPTSIFGLSTMSTFDLAHCGPLADIYRKAVTGSVRSAPKITDSSLDEVKRLSSGSLSVLDLMTKSTIASKNEDLLATRPIFAADLLQRYREELLRQPLDDNWKLYAQADLSIIVGLSNALEACLRVSADPVAAADDLEYEYEYEYE